MIRIRPVRIEDAEGVVNVLNPLVQAGESTALDRVITADEERIFISGFPARGVFNGAKRASHLSERHSCTRLSASTPARAATPNATPLRFGRGQSPPTFHFSPLTSHAPGQSGMRCSFCSSCLLGNWEVSQPPPRACTRATLAVRRCSWT